MTGLNICKMKHAVQVTAGTNLNTRTHSYQSFNPHFPPEQNFALLSISIFYGTSALQRAAGVDKNV